jgi:hypothetical protein
MQHFTKKQMQAARKANLYDYLMCNHLSDCIKDGNSLRPKCNHSISIKKGYAGYKDFSSDETGNSVDFLVRYMGYDLDTAVFALSEQVASVLIAEAEREKELNIVVPVEFPKPLTGRWKQLYAYLQARGISVDIINLLVQQKIIYQSAERNNIIFINRERDFAEARGTYTYGKPYHRIYKGQADRFWWFKPWEGTVECVYVCEAAIDAISLYQLHTSSKEAQKAIYVSLGGVANQQTIDRLKRQPAGYKVVLAVDNDAAGEACRKRNNDLDYILPEGKDWNEDLLNYGVQ